MLYVVVLGLPLGPLQQLVVADVLHADVTLQAFDSTQSTLVAAAVTYRLSVEVQHVHVVGEDVGSW